MTTSTRTRTLRWAVPGAAAIAVAVAASGVLSAGASAPLPPKTAAQLLVALQNAHVDGLSGTVVENARLGLPDIPSLGGQSSATSLMSLLTGSHTLRVWTGGEDKSRVALLGSLGESDVVRNGRDVWTWSSDTNTATHYQLPASDSATHKTPAKVAQLTPQEAADRALAAIDPTTTVSTDGTGDVAGRSAYELVLAPKAAGSLIGQVRIAIDSATSVPLRVQVYPRVSADGPALEVGFTRVSFAAPAERNFQFTPPSGATVKQGTLPLAAKNANGANGAKDRPAAGATTGGSRTVGTGWTAVAVMDGASLPGSTSSPKASSGSSGTAAPKRSGASEANQLAQILARAPRVSGTWGSGRLVTTTLVSVLVTDDGRVVVGAVTPDLLYRAAGTK